MTDGFQLLNASSERKKKKKWGGGAPLGLSYQKQDTKNKRKDGRLIAIFQD